MFRLKRYFSIIGFIAFIATAATLTVYYRYATTEQLIELNERNYLDLTQTIANTLWPQYRDFLKSTESLTSTQLVRHPLSGALHEDVVKIVHGLPVLKIKIYNTHGRTVFSTDSTQIGQVTPSGYLGRNVVFTGEEISKISHREIFRKIDGSDVYDRTVLASYFPIRTVSGNKVDGVIEIYTDVTETLSVTEYRQFVVAGVVLAILGLFYAILYAFIAHAERILIRQRKEYRQATEISSRMGRLLDSSANEIYIFDASNFQFIQVNQGARDNLGYSMEEMTGMTPWDLKPEFSREEFLEYIEPLRNRDSQKINFETVHERKDGSVYPVEVRLQLSYAEDPPVFVAMILDITERKQSEGELHKLSRAIEQSYNSVVITDPESRIEYVNPKFTELTGYSAAEVLGQKPGFWQSGDTSGGVYDGLRRAIKSGSDWHGELKNRRKDGSTYWVAESVSPLRNENNEITHYIFMMQDITYQKDAKDQLNYLAHYDSLTGLPNRRLLVERLQQAMKESDRNEHLLAVMFIDLDHFKNVNDSLGHESGDILLKEAAVRLKSCVRENDTVARLGGDEFTLVLSDLIHANNAIHIAEKIVEEFSRPFHIKNLSLCITVSIGVTLYPFDDSNVEGLLRNADTSMYYAKKAGRNNFKFYNHEMTARAERRLAIENDLRQALKRNEFVLHYQPQINTSNGAVEGMEALIRWQHPQRGIIAPDQFISVAEDTGLIIPVGEWVLREACKKNRDLQACGLAPISVSVNVSASQFRDPKLVQMVDQVLKDTGLAPSLLNLEITESMLMSEVEHAARMLEELSALGVTIAIDDFGTGYSSLSYLKRFPISTLKIDRSFIRDIPENKDDMLIIRAIINMADGLGINTIAEGVETREQLEFLKLHKCHLVQGYYFNKPVCHDEIIRLLQAEQGNTRSTGTGTAG
jgi:diguanylate cyclase (GGDEF)-like protein/PAS domain S-box-containing protein